MPGRLLASFALVAALAAARPAAAGPVPVPPDLPRYDLALTVDVAGGVAHFRQAVTWTNRHDRPTDSLAVNFYPLYRVPAGDRLLLEKTLELLRLRPEYGIDRRGRHGAIERITCGGQALAYHYSEENPTTIVAELGRPVGRGQSVVVVIEGTIRLPNKQGRWGQWDGITFLTNALPVVAYYDEQGWHDTPFVPWHQPFWNEAGVYTASITLPADQVLACSAAVASEADLGNGWKKVVTKPFVGRDFAVLCSAEYREYLATTRCPDGREVTLRCVARPHHEFYAKEILRVVAEAIPVYSDWFGPFPYDQFTVAESYFGWNGNELGGLVMIDERVFDMPHLARGYAEYLVSHETCHQWWYNQVGTNGYSETFMDEGAATYFTHRLLDQKRGKNNALLEWPGPVQWLPNIRRENYRFASWYGAVRRGDAPAAAGDLPEFGHLYALFSGAYDRGSKVFGLIEDRLGPEFLPFVRDLVRKYSFEFLSAERLKEELTAFTGPQTAAQWDEFFARWVYSKGLTDWAVERVRVESLFVGRSMLTTVWDPGPKRRVSVVVRQSGEYDEPTTLGIRFADGDGFPVRVPVPSSHAEGRIDEFDGTLTPLPGNRVRVDLTLPAAPAQVVIDPDGVLPDANPGNNAWKRPPRVNVVPLYTMLNETDLTNDYDRWNLSAGPWVWGPTYLDPWYTRSTLAGFRVGAYRTQTFAGGVYAAYRTDYRDVVVGADGLLDHWPWPKTQVGFNVEQRVAGPWDSNGEQTAFRATLFGRYVFQQSSSLYLHPLSYLDAFTTYSDNFLPATRNPTAGAVRPGWTQLNGLHYRLNLYTPYWDPDHGVWVDAVAAGGATDLGPVVGTAQLRGELAAVHKLPDGLGYFSDVKAAGRVVAMGAFPDRGEFFALGGGTLFRGFDLEERQGSFLWAANAELRFPLARDAHWNVLDNVVGGRNLYLAAFYDVGAVYANGRAVDGVAHAVGGGLRLDLAFFSFIERATVRFDVGKTLNAATPFQFWFGVQHPF